MKEAAADRRAARAEAGQNRRQAQQIAWEREKYGLEHQKPMSYSDQTNLGSSQKKVDALGVDFYGNASNLGKIEENIRKIIDSNARQHKNKKGDIYHGKIAEHWARLFTNGRLDVKKMKDAGEMNADGTMSKAYYTAYYNAIRPNVGNAKSVKDVINRANEYYNNFTWEVPQNTQMNETSKGILYGNQFTNYNGGGKKWRSTQFSNSYFYTPWRRVSVAGGGHSAKTLYDTSLWGQFNKFLRNAQIRMWEAPGDRSVTYAQLDRPGGSVERDLSGWVSVPKETIAPFVKYYSEKYGNSEDNIIRKLGLRTYSAQTKDSLDREGKQTWQNTTFVHIPITRTIRNDRTNVLSTIDEEYDKKLFGAANAYKMATSREESSINTP